MNGRDLAEQDVHTLAVATSKSGRGGVDGMHSLGAVDGQSTLRSADNVVGAVACGAQEKQVAFARLECNRQLHETLADSTYMWTGARER